MDIKGQAHELLIKNRRTVDGHQYTVPSPNTYPYQWLWDSCFHAIVLAKLEPEAAKAELRALMSKQLSNGMVPHMIYWEPGELYQFSWGTDGVSAITQPPMIAYAAWRVFQETNDLSFLKALYPSLISFYQYLVAERDPRDRHLVGIINPDESGEDNSPRFDAPLNVPIDISLEEHLMRRLELVDANRTCNFNADECMNQHFWVKDVPFNAILLKNLHILAHVASLLGEGEGEHFCTTHAELVSHAMRRRLLHDGIFYSAYGRKYEPISIDTWAHFIPLIADLYTQEEATAVVENYFRDEASFRAPFGMRTVSKKEPSYRSDGFWRGPVWMAPHWFIYRGLMRYGFKEDAAWLKDRSLALLERSGFREYYDPETGAGYGADAFTWGALVLDMEI